MKCLKCGGKLNYVEEVSGSFVYELDEHGEEVSHEFYGDSWNFLECSSCEDRPDFTFTDDGRYILKEGI